MYFDNIQDMYESTCTLILQYTCFVFPAGAANPVDSEI